MFVAQYTNAPLNAHALCAKGLFAHFAHVAAARLCAAITSAKRFVASSARKPLIGWLAHVPAATKVLAAASAEHAFAF
jgi:hypothetical protein